MANNKIVIGNWKMNPETYDEARRIAKKAHSAAGKLSHTEVVACPPFPFILSAKFRIRSRSFHMGAQSVSVDESGSHTGEVGAKMLKSLDVSYVIAGHSEERIAGDTDENISKRIGRVLEEGMNAVVCVGEKTRDESGSHLEFLKQQMKATLAGVSEEKARKIIIAYEPVWAIGAKEAMAPEQIYEMSLFVKKTFADIFGQEAGRKVKVLYGGSVNFRNAADIMKIGKVDGLLVGRESVNITGFAELLKAVDAVS